MSIRERVDGLGWPSILDNVDAAGFSLTGPLLSREECGELAESYDGRSDSFRSTVDMARYNYGSGQYRYFAYPLPNLVQELRGALYPGLATLANQWSDRLRLDVSWPGSHAEFIDKCRKNEQHKPTPLLLKYGAGDFNCLHRDLYGDVYFPLQVIVMLSNPDCDFTGGELVLVENRPRRQSRAHVVHIPQGHAAVVTVRERPVQGARGYFRAQMRHGVGEVRSGHRQTMGIIFHDAK